MQLDKYRSVPSGMSFDLDTGPTPLAYVLSTPGNTAAIGLTGTGTWTVEVLVTTDGVNYTVLAQLTTPGTWRYETKTAQAIALRVKTYSTGTISGMLAHGGLTPVTNVSALFGSFLIFSYNATPTEPPIGNQIRFNSASLPAVTKVWLSNDTTDGTDQYYAIRKLPLGGTLLVQEKSTHSDAVLFGITGPVLDKVDYIEVAVRYQQHVGTLAAAQAIVAVFNPGPTISLSSTLEATQLPAIPSAPIEPPAAPTLTALQPAAATLGSPDFTLSVLGEGFLPTDVILWNGSPEPTTFVSPTALTTGVNMATAQVAMPIPIEVATVDGLVSNTLIFTLEAPAGG